MSNRKPTIALAWLFAAIAIAQCLCSVALVYGDGPHRAKVLYRLGTPEGSVIDKGPWAVSFNGQTRTFRWTLECFNAAELANPAKRAGNFFSDRLIPAEFRPTLADFVSKAHDRGHGAAAANHPQADDKAATFSLMNVTHQISALNRGPWKRLEEFGRDQATQGTRVWVLTCTIFTSDGDAVSYQVYGPHRVGVPTHYGKSIVCIPEAKLGREALTDVRMMSWIMPNEVPPADAKLDDYRVPTDELETIAGLNVWPLLHDEIQSRLEGQR